MNKKNSQLIGVTLLSLLIVTYFQYFSPQQPTHTPTPIKKQVIHQDLISQLKQSVSQTSKKNLLNQKAHFIENKEIKVWLNPKGGIIEKVVLKNYKTPHQKKVTLLSDHKSHMAWVLTTKNGIINTKNLDFNLKKTNNTIKLSYTLDAEKKQYIEYTYTLPENGFAIDYKVNITGFNPTIDKAYFTWYYSPENLEKDFNLNKRSTYVQYQLKKNKKIKYLTKTNNVKTDEVEWVSIKQKFFTAGIMAEKNTSFTQTELSIKTDSSEDKNTLIETGIKLNIPLENQSQKNFRLIFAPIQQKTLASIGKNFETNLYLGFFPIKYVNKYLIAPSANFFDKYTNHYVWVILLLVLLFFILKLFFLYKDHIITLQQKALQPALEKLQATYKDKQQAKLAEISFYNTMGIPSGTTFLVKFVPILIELLTFPAMAYFLPNNISLRQVAFLWTNDLSSPDHFINLPFYIPLLGNHISLFALLMCLCSIFRSRQLSQSPPTQQNAKVFKYMLPFAMFLAFNGYAAAFCLYRIFSEIISLTTPLLFKLFINENFHIKKVMNKPTKAPSTDQKLPRSIVRLGKKNNKK